jgi:hypothetical protein
VEAWRSSGLSQAEYCKRHQVVYNTMNGWARRLAAEREDADRPLVELKASPTMTASDLEHRPAIELVVAGRYLLRLWPGTRCEQLREVITVLEERQ